MKLPHLSVFMLGMICIVPTLSFARGGDGSGGGDPCQNRIEEIRSDIAHWIRASQGSTPKEKLGSAQLDFSSAHTDLKTYNQKMNDLIALSKLDSQTSISCTSDPSKVTVGGAEKLCVAHMDSNRPRILCYRGKTQGDGKYVDGFLGASEEQQYFQVHHEFAVMANFEDQTGEETNYPLSRQISAHLESKVIKVLAVKAEHAKERPAQTTNAVERIGTCKFTKGSNEDMADMVGTKIQLLADREALVCRNYRGAAGTGTLAVGINMLPTSDEDDGALLTSTMSISKVKVPQLDDELFFELPIEGQGMLLIQGKVDIAHSDKIKGARYSVRDLEGKLKGYMQMDCSFDMRLQNTNVDCR